MAHRRPQLRHTERCQATTATRCRKRGQRAQPQRTTAQEQGQGDTQPTHYTPPPGVAGYKPSAHPNTHTPQQPSQEWRGAAEARAKAYTTTPHIPASSGGVQPERAHKHTQVPTPQPGVAGRSWNPSPGTHIHTANPSQEWQATTGARTQAHTHPNTQARSGGAQRKPEPKQTHPHRTPKPGVAGYKRDAHTNRHTPQHPSQEWRRADATRARAHTPTPHTPAGSGGVQAEHAHKHTHTQTPQPGVAGRSRSRSPSTHSHTVHPSQDRLGYKRSAQTNTQTPERLRQEWRGAGATRAQAHTPTPHTPVRRGGIHAERAHKHTNTQTAQPGVAGLPQPEPKDTHPHDSPKPGVVEYKRSAHTNTHAPQHPSQD